MELNITPSEIKDYAVALGWTLVEEALNDGLYVLNSPNDRQLIFVTDISDPKFGHQSIDTIRKISKIEGKTDLEILQEIREANDDIMKIRFFDNTRKVDSLSFDAAINAIEGAKQLLQAAANTSIEPRSIYKGRTRSEVSEFINQTKFRHTEEGSFVLKISTPLNYVPISHQLGLFVNEESRGIVERFYAFERNIYATANQAISELIHKINIGKQEEYAIEQLASEKPLISYNMVDALLAIFDQRRELPLEMSFKWSIISLKKITAPHFPTRILIPFEYYKKIENFKQLYEPEPEVEKDTFLAIVDNLLGEVGEEGREGLVTLKVFAKNRDLTNVKAYLNHDFHMKAIRAYESPNNVIIKVRGHLNILGRKASLDNIDFFEIADL